MRIKLDSHVGSIHREYQFRELNFLVKNTGNPCVLCRHLQWNHTHLDIKGGHYDLRDRIRNMRKNRNRKRESSGFGDLGGNEGEKAGRCRHQHSSVENRTKPNKQCARVINSI